MVVVSVADNSTESAESKTMVLAWSSQCKENVREYVKKIEIPGTCPIIFVQVANIRKIVIRRKENFDHE